MQRFAESVAVQERSTGQGQGAEDDDGGDEQPGLPATLQDPVVRKQKQFHHAKLAMRRLRAQAERKRRSDAPIGNALILARSAMSLLRGGADVSLGWQPDSARAAGVLCFDEMQARAGGDFTPTWGTCSHGCSLVSKAEGLLECKLCSKGDRHKPAAQHGEVSARAVYRSGTRLRR